MQDRPNVLFVITDQQRADHVGFAGNSVVRTPNLDSIANRGMVFDRCYVANPICMPNRASILTGRIASAHSVIFNDRSLPWSANTFVRQLRSAGYRTGLIGKSHFQHGMSANTVRPSALGPAIIDPYPEGWDTWEHPERHMKAPLEMPDDYYGFDTTELAIEHGGIASGHHLHWALAKGGDRECLTQGNRPDGPGKQRSDAWWQIFQPDFPEELYSTSFVTERTIHFIEEAAAESRPWFAWCSFPDPHHPLTPPGSFWDRHDPSEMSIPKTFGDALDDAPKFMSLLRGLDPAMDPQRYVNPFGPSQQVVREALAATYGMIEMIDEGVGQVLDTIERLDASRDTIVIYTSDHGDMMGDHGLIMKLLYHYQGVIRVPLAISDPRRPSGRSQSLVSSLDLGQTVLDLCGQNPFDDMQGHSLVSVLDDHEAVVRSGVLIEDDFPMGRAPGSPIPHQARTIIADEGRLTRYSSGETQLFDLAEDADEMHDLSKNSKGRERHAHMNQALLDAMMEHSDMARRTQIDESDSA